MNWYVLRSLDELYHRRSIPRKQLFIQDPDVDNMIHSMGILEEWEREIRCSQDYNAVYETYYLHQYEVYKDFLESRNWNKPQTRFEVKDIERLMEIEAKMQNGNLLELRSQIIAYNTSLRDVSHMFFRHEKYLEGKEALVNVLKEVLQVDTFSNERDQQYIYKLECHNPKLIVLCENLNFLTKPERARKYNIELWYAGGKNIDKLRYANNRGLPIYYSADWDKDGLEIFLLVKERLSDIVLLTPDGVPASIVTSEHRSLWQIAHIPSELSGLSKTHFTQQQAELIESLISKNQWIVEESNDLLQMLTMAGCDII